MLSPFLMPREATGLPSPEELALLTRLGVRVFTMSEVRARGLSAVFADALRLARARLPSQHPRAGGRDRAPRCR